ncbi:MAG: hypothetical protein ACYTCU_07750, partial [Planctomycetota bacterium]
SCTVAHQTIGRPIPASADSLRVGHTTKAEALSLLGPPVSVRRQFDGDLLFYRRDVVESWGILLVPLIPLYSHWQGAANSDILALLFNRDGVLSGIGVTRDIDS